MSGLALDYVSPLPPVRSGIADYSIDLLPHLEPLCDLRVVGLPNQPVAADVEARWHPVSSDELGQEGRVPLFQMGNNQHHEAVYRLAMRHPGVLTLHDIVLHHFLLGATLGRSEGDRRGFDTYRRRLRLEHGWQGEAAAAAMRWGAFGDSLQFGFPAHRRLVRRQRGILVHSEWARETLLEESADLQVRTIPMGIPLPATVDPTLGVEFRQRYGVPVSAPLLGSFGFQTPMKRPDVAVRALCSPELADVHLVIAGELAPTLELEAQIAEAELNRRVHVTGFLDFKDFEAAISACDLALNLRYPSAGETSAALLRVLAQGRPTVVSEYAQFAELPAEAAISIPVGEGEVEALVRETAALLAQPERLADMGKAARDYVRRCHDPATSATALVAASAELSRYSPPPRSDVQVAAPTTLTWSSLRGSVEVRGCEEPWSEGERRRLDVRLTNRGPARWLSGDSVAGGVGVRVSLTDGERHPIAERAWWPLPHDLAVGDSGELEIELRRPLGRVRLHIEPRRIEDDDSPPTGGPLWEREI